MHGRVGGHAPRCAGGHTKGTKAITPTPKSFKVLNSTQTLLANRAVNSDAISLRLVAPSSNDSNDVPPELYVTVSSVHVTVLPEPLRELIAFVNRFTALNSSSAMPVVSAAAAPPPPAAAVCPFPRCKLRLSVHGILLALPATPAPTQDSVGVVLEAQADVFVAVDKQTSRIEVEVQQLAARRSGLVRVCNLLHCSLHIIIVVHIELFKLCTTQMEPSATILRPFSLRMAAGLCAITGELNGHASIGQVSVVMTYSVRTSRGVIVYPLSCHTAIN